MITALRSIFLSEETDHTRAKKFINSGRNGVWAFKSFGVLVTINNRFAADGWHGESLAKHNITPHSKSRYAHDWWGSKEGDHIRFSVEVPRTFLKPLVYEYEVWITDSGVALGEISESEQGNIYRRVTVTCNGKSCIQSSISKYMDNLHWNIELIDYCSYDIDWNLPLQSIGESDELFIT